MRHTFQFAPLPIRSRVLQCPLHSALVKHQRFPILHLDSGRLEGEGVGVRSPTREGDEGRWRTLLQLRCREREVEREREGEKEGERMGGREREGEKEGGRERERERERGRER